MRHALVFGGAGQVGRAVAAALAADGWQVAATTHSALPTGLAATPVPHLGTRAATIRPARYDAVIDTMAFTAADLMSVGDSCGQLLVISTASVYAAAAGNGFEGETFPTYPSEIAEDQPTVPPGSGNSASKIALEQALDPRAIVLCPAAIHSIGANGIMSNG